MEGLQSGSSKVRIPNLLNHGHSKPKLFCEDKKFVKVRSILTFWYNRFSLKRIWKIRTHIKFALNRYISRVSKWELSSSTTKHFSSIVASSTYTQNKTKQKIELGPSTRNDPDLSKFWEIEKVMNRFTLTERND